MIRRRGIEGILQPTNETLHGRVVGLRVSRRRHEAAAQLAHGMLPRLSRLRNLLRCHGVECNTTRPVLGVMTLAAILLEHAPVLVGAGDVTRLGLCGGALVTG